jgi:hypothetical protein
VVADGATAAPDGRVPRRVARDRYGARPWRSRSQRPRPGRWAGRAAAVVPRHLPDHDRARAADASAPPSLRDPRRDRNGAGRRRCRRGSVRSGRELGRISQFRVRVAARAPIGLLLCRRIVGPRRAPQPSRARRRRAAGTHRAGRHAGLPRKHGGPADGSRVEHGSADGLHHRPRRLAGGPCDDRARPSVSPARPRPHVGGVLYPLGWPQPQGGTPGWWLLRIPWIAILAAILSALVALFGRFERARPRVAGGGTAA